MALKVNSQHVLSTNLVPNPSFEEYKYCPFSCSQIDFAVPWNSTRIVTGSSDYLNNCTTFYWLLAFLQKISPRTGDGCAGIIVMNNPFNMTGVYREYIATKLTKQLINKKKYCVNFFVIPFTSVYVIEDIGMFFSINQINSENPFFFALTLIDSVPQIKNNNGLINDTLNWTKISGVYEAKGAEEYITIGNFNNDINTNYWISPNSNPLTAYYMIDDVSVCECSFDINLGADTVLCEGETIILNPNLPNATYTWQDSSHTATYEVKQPGTYWVRAYVAEYDVYSSDTIVITQGDDNFCNPPLTIPNVITPNGDGANDNFVIQNAESYTITLQIYNRWGRLIYENTNYQNDFSCKTCAAGVYYYVLKAKSKRNGREKEYKGSLTIVNG
jgi:gliding motility-associated-like protein